MNAFFIEPVVVGDEKNEIKEETKPAVIEEVVVPMVETRHCYQFKTKGTCEYGTECRFRHEEAPNREQNQVLCDYYSKTGHCRYGANCKYIHDDEVAGTREVCLKFSTNASCQYGDKCRYQHISMLESEFPNRTCTHWSLYGRCRFGDHCKMTHLQKDPGSTPSPAICFAFHASGTCNYDPCRYMH